jgi:hypothetical protein
MIEMTSGIPRGAHRLAIAALVLAGCSGSGMTGAPPPPCPQGVSVGLDWSHRKLGGTPRSLAFRSSLCTMGPSGPPDLATAAPRDLSTAPPTDLASPPTVDMGGADTGPDLGESGSPDLGPVTPNLDWNYLSGPVNADPALWVASVTMPTATDAVYFANKTATGPNLFKLTNLYQTAPTLAWSASVAGGVDGSAIAFNLDGSKVYVLSAAGDLYCFEPNAGAMCAGWTAQFVSTGRAVSRSSPWVDYGTGAVYYGDSGGYINKIDGNTGAPVWSGNTGSPVHDSPVVYNSYIYVGDDAGEFLRALDPGPTPPGPGNGSKYVLCGTPPCGPEWAVKAGASIDTTLGKLYINVAGTVFEFPVGAGTWQPSATQSLDTPGGSAQWSSLGLDVDNLVLYSAYYNTLFKLPYPLGGGAFPLGRIMAGAGADASFPRSGPLPWSGSVYLGSGAGAAEQYGCLAANNSPDLLGLTIKYGATVDTDPLIDYTTGNIYFGWDGGDGVHGGLVQITQQGGWGCGAQSACATAGCGMPVAGSCTQPFQCVPDFIPADNFWLSSGGGAGEMASGFQIDFSVGGGLLVSPSAAPDGHIAIFGRIASETF